MKQIFVSLLLCFCLITQSLSANRYNNDWRSMPFIEMMATMMRVMNQVLGGNNSFANMNYLPYSPAFAPGMGVMPGFSSLSSLPMSPAGFNALPLTNSPLTPLQNNFQTGQNAPLQKVSNNFWDPDSTTIESIETVENNSLNGIWQTLSGDVIAIYSNNRFIWSNGGARNLAGHLAIKGNNMIAYIPAKKMTLYFQFYMEPGQFIVRDQKARIYTFKRIH